MDLLTTAYSQALAEAFEAEEPAWESSQGARSQENPGPWRPHVTFPAGAQTVGAAGDQEYMATQLTLAQKVAGTKEGISQGSD